MQFMVNLKSRVMIEKGVKSGIGKMGAAYYSCLNHPRLLRQNRSAYLLSLTHPGCVHDVVDFRSASINAQYTVSVSKTH